MAAQAPGNAIRWGAEHHNHRTTQFELFKIDPTQGYSYNLQDLTADFLRHVWQHDVIFNPTNSCIFNINYHNWTMCYQTRLEHAGIICAAFEHHPSELVVCCRLLSSLSNNHV